jgi:hypothetical protein
VHEKAEDLHEREGVDGVGEHQEEEVAEEGDETHFVVTGVVDEGEGNLEVMRQYERELEDDERALGEDSSDD